MSALQLWLQNHNRKLTQDAIDEALMEYISLVESQRDELLARIAEESAERDAVNTIAKRQSAILTRTGDELADCRTEIAALKAECDTRIAQLERQRVQELEGIRKAGYDIQDELREQLAAKDAVIERLTKRLASTNIIIEVVCAIHPDSACAKYELAENMNALAIPTDSTQILAEVRRAERERVAQMILNGRFLHDESPAALFSKEVAAAIRAME